MKRFKTNAFTLAEVLITLTVLGVIAAITIPSITKNISNKVDITKLKKAFVTLDSAIRQAQVTDGNSKNWNPNTEDFAAHIMPYLKNSQVCSGSISTAKTELCLPNNEHYLLNGLNNRAALGGSWELGVLPDGTVYGLQYDKANTSREKYDQIARLFIDINGKKKPNKMGYDRFIFPISSRNGIFLTDPRTFLHESELKPSGSGSLFPLVNSKNCDKFTYNDSQYNGFSCGYWVMLHNNMDYKYRDITEEW